VGVRDLAAPGLLSVSAPNVELCCDDPRELKVTKKSSKPSGANANFMDVRTPPLVAQG
jgi:hypothetical protein